MSLSRRARRRWVVGVSLIALGAAWVALRWRADRVVRVWEIAPENRGGNGSRERLGAQLWLEDDLIGIDRWQHRTGPHIVGWVPKDERYEWWSLSRHQRVDVVARATLIPEPIPTGEELLYYLTLRSAGGVGGLYYPHGREVVEWSRSLHRVAHRYRLAGNVMYAVLSPRGNRLAVSYKMRGGQERLCVYNTATRRRLSDFRLMGLGGWICPSFTPDGDRLLYANSIMDAATGRFVASVPLGEGSVFSNCELDRSGKLAAIPIVKTGTAGAMLVNLTERRVIRSMLVPGHGAVALGLSPDGRRLAMAVEPESRVRLYDTQRGALERELPWPVGVERKYSSGFFVSALGFSRDGRRLVGVSNHGVVCEWRVD